jgi:HAMP domain-containing protein
MTAGDWGSVLCGAAGVGSLVWNAWMGRHMRPLSELRKTIDQLKARITEMVHEAIDEQIGALARGHERHRQEIEKLKEGHTKCQVELLPRFATHDDLVRSEEHRDRQLGLINQKLDTTLQNDSAQNEALSTIKEQVSEIFRRINLR